MAVGLKRREFYTYGMREAAGAAGIAAKVDVLFDAALDEMARGDAEAAVLNFARITALQPDHTEARHGLIRALEDAGRVEDALHETQELIASNPEDVLAFTRLSMIYQHKGMVPEAEAAAARAKILGWKMELRTGVMGQTDL